MDAFWMDLRYAARRLARSPSFTFVAVLTLALGIGANSAIFSVVNGVLFRSLPFNDPEALVRLGTVDRRQQDQPPSVMSAPDFMSFREENRVFEDVVAYTGGSATLAGLDEPQRLDAAWVSAGFFELFGAQPVLGRSIRPEENQPGSDRVVVLSHGTWQQTFGGRRDIIGETLTLNGLQREVVGVMPPGFGYPDGRAMWMPLPYNESFSSETATNRRAQYLTVLARLRPGATVEQAATEIRTIASRLEQRFTDTNTNVGAVMVPLHEMIVGEVRTPLLILLGAVGLVLLIACANVANLLLARATAREGEFAVRAALGAGRTRLIRQLLTESLLLGLLGGAVGLLLAWYGTDVLVALRPEDIPRLENVGIDAAAVLFTGAAALLTGLIFGLIPALQVTRANLTGSLKEGGRALAGRSRNRVRHGLVIGEMALAVMLLIGAGLLLRSFVELQQVDPGFQAEGTLAFDLSLPSSTYTEPVQIADFYGRLLERLETLSGVQFAGATTVLPLGGNQLILTFDVEGEEPALPGAEKSMLVRAATPDYFRTVGVPTRRGRVFTEADRAGAPGVVVLNEAAVQRFFPNEDPIGKRIQTGWGFGDGTFAGGEVVGIVGNVRQNSLGEDAAPELYLPHAQFSMEEMIVVVRTARQDPLALVNPIREEVRALDPNLPPTEFRTLEQVVSRSVSQPRFYTLLLSVFAGVALILAGIGIFGVISYAVAQRTREIGIRVALGASVKSVLRLVVGGVVGLAAGGAVLGVIGSLALSRLLLSLLYGITATDLTTYVAVVAILFSIALIASYIPARRAARVDPMVALRAE